MLLQCKVNIVCVCACEDSKYLQCSSDVVSGWSETMETCDILHISKLLNFSFTPSLCACTPLVRQSGLRIQDQRTRMWTVLRVIEPFVQRRPQSSPLHPWSLRQWYEWLSSTFFARRYRASRAAELQTSSLRLSRISDCLACEIFA